MYARRDWSFLFIYWKIHVRYFGSRKARANLRHPYIIKIVLCSTPSLIFIKTLRRRTRENLNHKTRQNRRAKKYNGRGVLESSSSRKFRFTVSVPNTQRPRFPILVLVSIFLFLFLVLQGCVLGGLSISSSFTRYRLEAEEFCGPR